MPLVLAAVFLILVVLLRSLVAPLLLLGAVVAVWGAALGIGGLVFGPLLGFAGTDPGIGLLSFVFLVALGVDYGIFLMHRMREESLNGAEPEAAALTALRTTGGVIASAGVVLAATFAVLTTLPWWRWSNSASSSPSASSSTPSWSAPTWSRRPACCWAAGCGGRARCPARRSRNTGSGSRSRCDPPVRP